jgi:hypothetical protein
MKGGAIYRSRFCDTFSVLHKKIGLAGQDYFPPNISTHSKNSNSINQQYKNSVLNVSS